MDVMFCDYRHWLEYDMVALAVLFVGVGLVELIVLSIWICGRIGVSPRRRSPRFGVRHNRLRSDLAATQPRPRQTRHTTGSWEPDHRHRRLLRARSQRPSGAPCAQSHVNLRPA